jgi:hypothetical protein
MRIQAIIAAAAALLSVIATIPAAEAHGWGYRAYGMPGYGYGHYGMRPYYGYVAMPGPWAVAPAYGYAAPYGYGYYGYGYHRGPMSRPGLYGGGF